MDVPALLRELRVRSGLSQRQLAARAGTSGPAVAHYESGRRVPRVDTLVRLLDAAGVEHRLVVEFDGDVRSSGDDRIDLAEAGRRLAAVLDLADALPSDHTEGLEAPVFRRLVRGVTSLAQRIVELHRRFVAADLPHAFGGALALAYCTRDPRGTDDIDCNLFVAPSALPAVEAALRPVVESTPSQRAAIDRDGQARLWWDDTPVDVFFATDPFHDEVAARCRAVPFLDVPDLPVLACADLGVFKALFARPRDEVDVATMAAVDAVDVDALERQVAVLLGSYDDRRGFFDAVRRAMARL